MMDLFIVQVQHGLFDLNSYIAINSAVEYYIYPENYYSSLSHVKGMYITLCKIQLLCKIIIE